jgi:hypothetical protein
MMSSLAALHVHKPQHHAYRTDLPYTQHVSYKQNAMSPINSNPYWAVKASQPRASNARVSHMRNIARCMRA